MSVQNVEQSIYNPVDVEIFHRVSENFDLLVEKQEMSGIHPLGTMNVSTKLNFNNVHLFFDTHKNYFRFVQLYTYKTYNIFSNCI